MAIGGCQLSLPAKSTVLLWDEYAKWIYSFDCC